VIPTTCNRAALLVELVNFDKYRLLIDQFSQGAGNSKSKRDLTEMRFLSVFQACLDTLQGRLDTGQQVILVATCEKRGDMLESVVKSLVQGRHLTLRSMEKGEREDCISWLLENEPKL